MRPEHEVGVGDGGLLAAGAVAGGAGLGPGAVGADRQRPVLGDAGDGAAAGADRVDVDHRHLQRPGAHAALDRHLRLAAAHEAHVGAGAADVHGDQVGEPGRLADPPGADRRRRRGPTARCGSPACARRRRR